MSYRMIVTVSTVTYEGPAECVYKDIEDGILTITFEGIIQFPNICVEIDSIEVWDGDVEMVAYQDLLMSKVGKVSFSGKTKLRWSFHLDIEDVTEEEE